VTFYVYPNNSISGDVLDLTIAISIFLSAVAVLLLWGHYLKFVGREHENQGRRLVVGKAVVCKISLPQAASIVRQYQYHPKGSLIEFSQDAPKLLGGCHGFQLLHGLPFCDFRS
jgi:hypothetical protein